MFHDSKSWTFVRGGFQYKLYIKRTIHWLEMAETCNL
jgi:hypothetical protein